MSPGPRLEELIDAKRILVCVGTGGVGKTTLSGAIALEAARRGRRTVVLTIDPARRLADALGVAELGNEPTALDAATLRRLGVPEGVALSAVMLDMRRTFDDLVVRFSDSPEVRERIFQNRIYQHVSDALAGSAEYAAMEKVFELSERPDFDLIVVDTPPSQHALDFLAAPRRLVEFLDSRLVQILVHPAFAAGRLGFRIFQRGSARVLRLIERVSGVAFLEDVSEFLLAFEGMSEGFRERARRVQARLLGPDCGFLITAAPAPESVKQGMRLFDRLDEAGVPLGGVILNRVRAWPGGDAPPERVPDASCEEQALQALAAALAEQLDAEAGRSAAHAAFQAADGYASLVRTDLRAAQQLDARAAPRGAFLCLVPELRGDVHDLEGLGRVADGMFRGGWEEGVDRATGA